MPASRARDGPFNCYQLSFWILFPSQAGVYSVVRLIAKHAVSARRPAHTLQAAAVACNVMLRRAAARHVYVQEDLAGNAQMLCMMPSLQQLLLDVVCVDEVSHVCDFEAMTTLTKLHLSISEAGFSGAAADLRCGNNSVGVMNHCLLSEVLS
jgi:hypothetical protein